MLFYFCVCVMFVGYNFKVLHCRHVRNYELQETFHGQYIDICKI
jgi:hypothetical protein